MTILKDLIMSVSFESVREAILKLYPDQDINIDGYERVFQKLVILDPCDKDEKWVLDIRKCKSIFNENETYWDVSGLWLTSTDPEQLWGLGYTPWNQWLSMEVNEEQLNIISVNEYIAHCLWEMTYSGFDEEEIQNKVEDLSKRVENACSSEIEIFDLDIDS